MTTEIKDLLEDGFSNCCGANVYTDICMDCKEHCELITEDKTLQEGKESYNDEMFDTLRDNEGN